MTRALAGAGKSTNSAVGGQYKTVKKAYALRGEDGRPAAGRSLWPVVLFGKAGFYGLVRTKTLPVPAGRQDIFGTARGK